jgi:hypothetical protein
MRGPLFVAADLEANSSGPTMRTGYRFSLDVAEDALRAAGPRAVDEAIRKLAEHIAFSKRGDIEATVASYVTDRKWVEPLIKEALREAVHAFVFGMFDDA